LAVPTEPVDLRCLFDSLLAGRSLSEPDADAVFSAILAGSVDDAQIGALLALIQARGPTVEELTGAARQMRRRVTPVPVAPSGVPIVDTCGTGGTRKTFNVSTAAAIVAAAAAPGRLRVAKHGNRSRTGRGSAEVLHSLGVNVDASPETQARCLDQAGVCFCFAIHHHPAARHAASVRRSLGFPTIFNLLGPLTNPASASHQLLGVYDPRFIEPIARVLARLGSMRAMVVHSRDGLDEISTAAPTDFAWLDDDRTVRTGTIDPGALAIAPADPDSITPATVEASAALILRILDAEPSPAREMVALNAAATLLVAGLCPDLKSGLALARVAIDAGRARATLDRLAELSHGS